MADSGAIVVADDNPGLINRTLDTFRRAIRGTGISALAPRAPIGPELGRGDVETLREQFQACLDARGGEVKARAQAASLGATYLGLSDDGRRRFVEMLASEFDVDSEAISNAITSYQSAANDDKHAAQAALRDALIAPRVRLLTRFNELSLGVKFLVDLRADIRKMKDVSPSVKGLDRDLRELLTSWFDVGFLELTRITWNTPAALLEKLIRYEAVHAIRSWDDLKHRLDEDRRCYAFFHPCMPDEPLIFVQVALVDGLSDNIHDLLDEELPVAAPEASNTAIFYSISNCQSGLAGVSFGNFLIKQVASDLNKELPNLKTFSTLSPIPGFRRWLRAALGEPDASALLSDAHRAQLTKEITRSSGDGTPHDLLQSVVETPDMLLDPDFQVTATALEPVLKTLCAQYLLRARNGQRAKDPVAHFHLTNGARVERLNWLGDRSTTGLNASLGMMVNYRYVLDDVDENHETYVLNGKVPAVAAVRKLDG